MTTLSDLIARLEAALCGSYELDATIAEVIGVKSMGEQSVLADPFGKSDRRISRPTYPAYTTSLDAALTLVPERDMSGCYWRIAIERKPVQDTLAWIAEVRPHAANGGNGIGHSAALALCIAALKARKARR